MRARRLQRPNRGEGPFVWHVNTRSLRAARPLTKTRGSLTPFEMTVLINLNKREIQLYIILHRSAITQPACILIT